MLVEGLFSVLTSDSAITGIVGDRVYPLLMPQSGTIPAIVYSQIGRREDVSLCSADGKIRATIQIDSYSKQYRTSKMLADAVRSVLVDFTGAMGDARVATVILDQELDLDDPEPGLFRVSQTFFIWYG